MRGKKYKQVDPFASEYTKELNRWEYVVQTLLATLIEQQENRILKYAADSIGHKYREIDFVAQPKIDELIFCELKLKANFKYDLRSKESGWAQLNKSIAIASQKYTNLTGLAICVDMSFVYGLESEALSDLEYCQFQDIFNYLSTPQSKKCTIWLNSSEITELAILHGLLTYADLDKMREVYRAQKEPLSILGEQDSLTVNNPFQVLEGMRGIHELNSNINRTH